MVIVTAQMCVASFELSEDVHSKLITRSLWLWEKFVGYIIGMSIVSSAGFSY